MFMACKNHLQFQGICLLFTSTKLSKPTKNLLSEETVGLSLNEGCCSKAFLSTKTNIF